MTTSTGVPFFAIFETVEQCCERLQWQDLSGGLLEAVQLVGSQPNISRLLTEVITL